MKYFSIICLLFICLFAACNDSSSANDEDSLKNILPGTWEFNVEGTVSQFDVAVTDNELLTMGRKFTSKYTDTKYTGSSTANGVTTNIVMNKVSNTSISGYTSSVVFGNEVIINFTATKIK